MFPLAQRIVERVILVSHAEIAAARSVSRLSGAKNWGWCNSRRPE